MKKIISLLMVLLLMGFISCKPKNPTDGETNNFKYHYDFLTEEEIKSKLDFYWLKLSALGENYEFIENDKFMYTQMGQDTTFVDKETADVYSLSHSQMEKSVEGITEETTLLEQVYKFFSYHLAIKDSNYVLLEKPETICGYSCDVYEFNEGFTDRYYVSKELGVCLKRYTVKNNTVVDWEFTKVSFDESKISEELNSFNNYQLIDKYVFYNEWPNITLTSYIPSIRVESINACCANNVNFFMDIASGSLNLYHSYINKLDDTLFKHQFSRINDNNQYRFIAYTDEYLILTVTYTSGNSQMTIDLTISNENDVIKTMEDFNNAYTTEYKIPTE